MSDIDNENLFCRCLHHGREHRLPGDPLEPPIVPTSVYHLPGEPTAEHQYGRWSNPTWSALEEALSTLEDAESVIFPSGMAAIAAIFYTLLKPGDRILLPSDGYYTTRTFTDKFLVPLGVSPITCPSAEYDAKDFAGFRLVWVESPSNPGLDICDIGNVTKRAKQAGALVVADNTTLTPLGQRPLDLGADVIISSDSKILNGHSDVLFGHVASRNTGVIAKVRDWRKLSGVIPGQFEAWLVHRGIETLEVRFDRMCTSAETIAQNLLGHPKIHHVRFPGLSSHPAHSIARNQMMRFGTLLGVSFADRVSADRFINECKFVRAATSFGGVHTSAERRARWGDNVTEGFVRLSVGCEPTKALWKEIKRVIDSL
jgi:cystathionine gamma-lyase